MNLKDVYEDINAPQILYALLAERTPEQAISHKEMPTEADHMAFYLRRPYIDWCLIQDDDETTVGAIYLSMNCEIGLFIYEVEQGKGFGSEALRLFIDKHAYQRRLLANISPKNQASQAFFRKHGFKMIQATYALEAT